MTDTLGQGRTNGAPRFSARVMLGAISALSIVLIFAGGAGAAPFHQVGTFAGSAEQAPQVEFPEEVQLGGVAGLAVNYTGAGGVEPGTIYAITQTSFRFHPRWVAAFKPTVGGPPAFDLAWEFHGDMSPFERCGPALGVEEQKVKVPCEPQISDGVRPYGIAVDQTTGDVYVLDGFVTTPGAPLVTVYNAEGSEILTQFADLAALAPGETTAESPEQVHEISRNGALAVDDAGNVYIYDLRASESYHRIMEFSEQVPGDVSSYAYAGPGSDVAAGFNSQSRAPAHPVVDAAGNIYVAPEEKYIQKYDLSVSRKNPVCTYEFAKGGIGSLAVNPLTGEVFFFTYKKEAGIQTKLIHQLAPCQAGTFKEVGKIEVSPERGDLSALAVDPLRRWVPGGEAGILYGGAPTPTPDVGVGQPGQSGLGYVFAPIESNPPVVEEESVGTVTTNSAQVRARINPKGRATTYVFQYTSDAAYQANPSGQGFLGAAEVPFGGGTIQGGQEGVAVGETLTGLAPGTAYHFRVVATNHCVQEEPEVACPAVGMDELFITAQSQSGALPDGRAYELVSPSEKNGGQVIPADSHIHSCNWPECKPGTGYTRFWLNSSPDGNGVAYEGTPFFPGSGIATENQYLASRDPQSGWHSVNLTPSLLATKNGPGYKAFDPSLNLGVMQQGAQTLSAGAPEGVPNFYLQASGTPGSLQPLLTEGPPNRQPGSGVGGLRLEYVGASTDLSRIFFRANDALTGPTGVAPEAAGGPSGEMNLYEWEGGNLRLVNVAPGNNETFPGAEFGGGVSRLKNAVSADGSHVYWTSSAGQLFVRINGTETQAIGDPGNFVAASVDGSRVVLDDGCLYYLAAGTCEDLAADEGGVHKGGFKGLLGESDDLSRVYFVDSAVLVQSGNNLGATPQPGADNLYLRAEGSTVFIGTLAAKDEKTWEVAEASPSGRWFAFLSRAPLTGYNNVGPCERTRLANLLIPCSEAFMYDSLTGELRCASCNPTNTRPLGETVLRQREGVLNPQPRYVTDSGRLYFDTQNSLTPSDTNGGAEDVYQFEPAGVGSCSEPAGCVSLISGGRDPGDSNFLAMDPSGDNVFFTTRERLVPSDKDALIDLYDARVGGGFASESEPGPSPCSGDACQSTQPPLSESQPNSTSPTEGNVKPAKCKKGQVKKNGHCVKKKQKGKHKQKGKGKKHKGKAQKHGRGGSK